MGISFSLVYWAAFPAPLFNIFSSYLSKKKKTSIFEKEKRFPLF